MISSNKKFFGIPTLFQQDEIEKPLFSCLHQNPINPKLRKSDGDFDLPRCSHSIFSVAAPMVFFNRPLKQIFTRLVDESEKNFGFISHIRFFIVQKLHKDVLFLKNLKVQTQFFWQVYPWFRPTKSQPKALQMKWRIQLKSTYLIDLCIKVNMVLKIHKVFLKSIFSHFLNSKFHVTTSSTPTNLSSAENFEVMDDYSKKELLFSNNALETW